MSAAPFDPYDIHTAVLKAVPGVILDRDTETALLVAYNAQAPAPLTAAQIIAITGPAPALPKGLKRFADSNPSPRDNWSIETAAEVAA